MESTAPDWIAAGSAWVAADPNAETRGAIQAMVDAKDLAGLEQALGARMAFGTSGLRASMGTGVCCMNELTIIQTTQGLCQYVENVFGEEGKARGIAIGFDHRRMGSLNSHIFAKLSASVFLSRGFKVYLCGGIVATPVVPFCIQEHGCAAGIMVTASHNPKQDNGYKVYWENGAQIIPPHDDGIADLIVKPENLAPWPGNVAAYAAPDAALAAARESGLLIDPTEALSKTYFSAMRERLCSHHADNLAARASGAAVSAAGGAARVVYTAMHGVGHAWTSRSFEAFGLPAYVPVEEQLHPDPDFPTVPFPNPEEGKGALALAVARAKASGAGLILANDPDADRLGAAIEVDGGEWRMLTGDEIGLLLGHWMWTKYKLRKGASLDRGKVAMVGSTVSSKMLRAVAEKEGFRYEEVLTGFKWIGSKSAQLKAEGYDVLFSYEESIGFCCGDVVFDKDGVIGAAVFAEMSIQLGRLDKVLDGLHAEYGSHATYNSYYKCYEPATVDRIFGRLRNEGRYWLQCAGYRLSHVRDLTTGVDTSMADGKPTMPCDSRVHMLTFTFANGMVMTLRTSGTEPKLKYYCELTGEAPGEDNAVTKERVAVMARAVLADMLQPEVNNLESPPE